MNDTHPSPKPTRLTVVVAEKQPVARAGLAAMLSHEGHRVFQTDNVARAMALIDNLEDVAALLLDLDMADWRSLALHASRTTRPLVIAMAGAQRADQRELASYEISVCLEKPVLYARVQSAIANLRALDASQLVAAAPAKKPATVTSMNARRSVLLRLARWARLSAGRHDRGRVIPLHGKLSSRTAQLNTVSSEAERSKLAEL